MEIRFYKRQIERNINLEPQVEKVATPKNLETPNFADFASRLLESIANVQKKKEEINRLSVLNSFNSEFNKLLYDPEQGLLNQIDLDLVKKYEEKSNELIKKYKDILPEIEEDLNKIKIANYDIVAKKNADILRTEYEKQLNNNIFNLANTVSDENSFKIASETFDKYMINFLELNKISAENIAGQIYQEYEKKFLNYIFEKNINENKIDFSRRILEELNKRNLIDEESYAKTTDLINRAEVRNNIYSEITQLLTNPNVKLDDAYNVIISKYIGHKYFDEIKKTADDFKKSLEATFEVDSNFILDEGAKMFFANQTFDNALKELNPYLNKFEIKYGAYSKFNLIEKLKNIWETGSKGIDVKSNPFIYIALWTEAKDRTISVSQFVEKLTDANKKGLISNSDTIELYKLFYSTEKDVKEKVNQAFVEALSSRLSTKNKKILEFVINQELQKNPNKDLKALVIELLEDSKYKDLFKQQKETINAVKVAKEFIDNWSVAKLGVVK